MKILIAAQTYAPQDEGGAEISTRMAALELQRQHSVTVLSLGHPADELANVGTSCHDGIRVIRIPFYASYLPGQQPPNVTKVSKALWHTRAATGATSIKDIAAILEAERPNVIYSQNTARMQPALWRAAELVGIPVVQHLRDYAFLCPKASMFSQGANCLKQCFKCKLFTSRFQPAMGTVPAVIAVSEFVKTRFQAHGAFAKSRWHVMYNTNTAQSRFDSDTIQKFSLGEHPDQITVGYLGALSQEKGVGDLVSAFVRVSETNKNLRLIIAGRGSEAYVTELRSQTTNYPVQFLGQVPPHQVYGQADVIVSSSRWHEPQSRILVEAAVYGVPVLATDRGGSSEFIASYQTGWLYEPDDKNALHDSLKRISDMGSSSWQRERLNLFPGLRAFKGTAEDSNYYQNLNQILMEAVANYVRP